MWPAAAYDVNTPMFEIGGEKSCLAALLLLLMINYWTKMAQYIIIINITKLCFYFRLKCGP